MQEFAFGFITSFIFLKVIIPLLLLYAPDKPNKRSSHKITTAGSGGIAFILPILIFALIQRDYQWYLCLPIAIVGLIDDRIKLSASIRYLAQLLTVYLITTNTIFLNYSLSGLYDYLILIFLIFLGTAIINFVNFMDGVDGLVSGCFFIIILFASFFSNPILFVLAASLLAFLIFNWQPAKVFMGDVGSTFLGAIFVLIIFGQNNPQEGIRYMFLGAPIFIDAASTVIRRYSFSQNIFKAHKSHLFQRLYDSGWSHAKISILYILFSALLFLTVLLNNLLLIVCSIFTIIIFGIILDFKFATPFEKSI